MDGDTRPTRRSKITGLHDAAILARDALRKRPELCLGGLFKQGRPVALVRALLATGAGWRWPGFWRGGFCARRPRAPAARDERLAPPRGKDRRRLPATAPWHSAPRGRCPWSQIILK